MANVSHPPPPPLHQHHYQFTCWARFMAACLHLRTDCNNSLLPTDLLSFPQSVVQAQALELEGEVNSVKHLFLNENILLILYTHTHTGPSNGQLSVLYGEIRWLPTSVSICADN